MNRYMTQMTDAMSEKKKPESGDRFGRGFLLTVFSPTVALLIVALFVAVTYASSNGVSEYEKQAIEVVSMQNDITVRWNETVDAFNDTIVTSQGEHVTLFTLSLGSVHDLITDSQAVINRWQEIDVPDKHLSSYLLGLEALMAMQDGLILFEEYFQNSIDTMVADQIRAERAEAKLVHAAELWQAAADTAATEG